MNFSIGYQNNEALKQTILRNVSRISEIYFPWLGFTSGRGTVDGYGQQRQMEDDLAEFANAGLGMNLLLNGGCYGRQSQSRMFFQSIGDTIDDLIARIRLGSITTTSPLIARFVKMNFSRLEVRASVNMEIGSENGMDYLADLFDGFYLKREYNRDIGQIHRVKNWCGEHNKKLFLLANSGCLNFCSAHYFHDNLVAHQHEIAEMDNAFEFVGICHDYLANPDKRADFLSFTNFIRPNDLALYEGLFDGVKLATRVNRNPSAVVEAYLTGRYAGNILDLMEPAHSEHFYPFVLENGRFSDDFGRHVLNCDKICRNCQYCRTALQQVLVDVTLSTSD